MKFHCSFICAIARACLWVATPPPKISWHSRFLKGDQTTGFSCAALTLQVEWPVGHPAHKNPVVVPCRKFLLCESTGSPGCAWKWGMCVHGLKMYVKGKNGLNMSATRKCEAAETGLCLLVP